MCGWTCVDGHVLRLLRFLLCLSESPLFPLDYCLCYLSQFFEHSSHSELGEWIGFLLKEFVEANGRFVDLTDFTEEILWDNIGIVAGEDYRLSLKERLGYIIERERTSSPGICS